MIPSILTLPTCGIREYFLSNSLRGTDETRFGSVARARVDGWMTEILNTLCLPICHGNCGASESVGRAVGGRADAFLSVSGRWVR